MVGINVYVDIKISNILFLARLTFLGIKTETKEATMDAIYAYHAYHTCRSHARVQVIMGLEI